MATLVPMQEEDFLEDEEEDAEVDEMEPWKGGYVKTFLDRLVSFKLFQGAQSRLKGDTWSCHYAYGSLLPH